MQYMMFIKSNAALEAETPVNDAGFQAIERYNQRLYEAGLWVSAEGFKPSDTGAVVTLEHGDFRVEKGPFPNPEKIDAGYWIIQVGSKEEAIDWAKQAPMLVEGSEYATGDGEIVLMPCMEFPEEAPAQGAVDEDATEPVSPAAAANLKRYFGGFTASPETEAGVEPDHSIYEAMGEVIGRLAVEGRVEGGGGLLPTSAATRVMFSNGTPVVSDGPFAETKEVIAGYAIFRAANLDEMIKLSKAGMTIEARWRKEPIVGVIREIQG